MAKGKGNEERAGKKLWDPTAKKDAAFFLEYLKPHYGVFIPALLAIVVSGGLMLAFVHTLGDVMAPAVAGQTGPVLMEHVGARVLLLIGLAAAMAFIAFWRILLFAKASERALATLRMQTYSRIIRLPMSTLNVRRTGELASRLANDVESMRDTLVLTIPMLLRHTIVLVGSVIMVFTMSAKLALFMMATIPVVITLIAIFGSRIRKRTRKAQDKLAASQVIVDESLQSIVSVKAFANERFEISRYNSTLGGFVDAALSAALPRASFIAFIIFSFSTAISLVLWFALHMVAHGEMEMGKLVKFFFFSGTVGASFMQFPELIAQLQRTLGATDRVREILKDEATEPDDETPSPRLHGDIEMRGVEFAYPTRPDTIVLRDFSFSVKAGQRIALVGPSGSGKSTTVSLLFRFYDPQKGEILLDGKPITNLPLHGLRRNFALVPQEVLLFGGTIKENIAYGRPGATDTEIEEAARQANAEEFVLRQPDGYQTIVGERGTQLSGGQRQRIAIARAILADPAILILDEATSSLDAESERLVQDALDKLMQNSTSIIIAHRLSTVRTADQILVMSGGAIIERGTHEELMAAGHSLYATLAKLQLG
ncbi:MAG: lipid ABC-type exporter, ATP-binding/permease protein MsbA [Verrucomicrobiaceae bacterium]|nr:lipid ABC-type exporter, ATP-binding/permease protein MsbA [Verrucomicrobiaceae bacterium]